VADPPPLPELEFEDPPAPARPLLSWPPLPLPPERWP
jgi:hypothetical protein